MLGTHLLGWRCICAVENNPYRQAVLLARQEDGIFPPFPIWSDVRDFDGRPWRGKVQVVSAGFPCQPFSQAGLRKGETDERNLWPETIRVIREVQPRVCLLENTPGLVAHPYFGQILGDLAAAGFDAEWGMLSACALGAPHMRFRLFIVAHANNGDGQTRLRFRQPGAPAPLQGRDLSAVRTDWLDSVEQFARKPDGMARWVESIAAAGDGQVPSVVAAVWRLLR